MCANVWMENGWKVNLSNLLHTGDETCKGGIHLGFDTQGKHHQKSKTEVQVKNIFFQQNEELFQLYIKSTRLRRNA